MSISQYVHKVNAQWGSLISQSGFLIFHIGTTAHISNKIASGTPKLHCSSCLILLRLINLTIILI
jgi:hypothetical protein